jgi:hypothetical protein
MKTLIGFVLLALATSACAHSPAYNLAPHGEGRDVPSVPADSEVIGAPKPLPSVPADSEVIGAPKPLPSVPADSEVIAAPKPLPSQWRLVSPDGSEFRCTPSEKMGKMTDGETDIMPEAAGYPPSQWMDSGIGQDSEATKKAAATLSPSPPRDGMPSRPAPSPAALKPRSEPAPFELPATLTGSYNLGSGTFGEVK